MDQMSIATGADELEPEIAARVCWHYFKEGQTQEEVAQRLGFTRKRVNRIISQALASGFVQITIDSRYGACAELEVRLKARFGLRLVKVVPAPAPEIDVRTVVGAAAGQYLSETLGPSETIGITWGGTIGAAAQNLRRRTGGNTVVSLIGGLATSGPINPYDNAAVESFFSTLKTECLHRHTPTSRRETKALAFDYIETFYNRTRLHSALGYKSPVDFENSHH